MCCPPAVRPQAVEPLRFYACRDRGVQILARGGPASGCVGDGRRFKIQGSGVVRAELIGIVFSGHHRNCMAAGRCNAAPRFAHQDVRPRRGRRTTPSPQETSEGHRHDDLRSRCRLGPWWTRRGSGAGSTCTRTAPPAPSPGTPWPPWTRWRPAEHSLDAATFYFRPPVAATARTARDGWCGERPASHGNSAGVWRRGRDKVSFR